MCSQWVASPEGGSRGNGIRNLLVVRPGSLTDWKYDDGLTPLSFSVSVLDTQGCERLSTGLGWFWSVWLILP